MSQYPAVLYVEDDPMSRSVMEILMLHQLGLSNVVIFPDSSGFHDRLDELSFQPDIIFLDIHMEPIDGFQMLEILRSYDKFADVPIVALTASVMNEEVMQLKEAGFNGVIPKPLDLDTFPNMLDALVQGQEIWRIIKT